MSIYLDKLYTICEVNKYTKWYMQLIRNSLAREAPLEYTERHHILPKCVGLGGDRDPTNLVYLTAKEHYICHLLLPRMIVDKIVRGKLAYAAWQLATQDRYGRRYKVTARLHAVLREQLSACTKGIPKTEAHKQAMRKPKSNTSNMKGGPGSLPGGTRTLEQKLHQSKLMKGRYTGENNPFFGKQHPPELIEQIRQKNIGRKRSAESIAKGVAKHKGRIGITDGVKNKKIWPDDLPNWDPVIWRRGRV